MATAPTSWTGTTWPGSYGPGGQLYYYGGKPFKTPEELYSALGQPYDPNVLPYGTTVYGPGTNSGMSDWDSSVRNNPYGSLDQIGTGTASLYANAANAQQATAPTGATTGGTPATMTGATNTNPIGGGGGTGTTAPAAATTGPPPGVATGATGTVNPPAGNLIPGPGGSTPAGVFDPLDDPRQSVYRALLANGFNPDIPTWGMNQLQKRATDIVTGAMGRVAWGGNPDTLTTPGAFQDYINSLVGQSGKMGIMPTADQGRSYLDSINTLMKGDNRSAGATYLSSILGADPEKSAALAETLRYQGFAPSVRSALARPLGSYGTRFQQFAETPEGFGVVRDNNALDVLLNNMIPGYRPLF